MISILLTSMLGYATIFSPSQCQSFTIGKGDHGSGQLRYCANSTHQQLYVSGEMDVGEDDSVDCAGNPRHRRRRDCRDYRSVEAVKKLFKKRTKGTFEVITEGAGGGDVNWHQQLIMKVEDSCTKDCRITTKIRGRCESACAQLHVTCVKNAESIMEPGGQYCEHATNDAEVCNLCDPNYPDEPCYICPPKETIREYTDRCDEKELLAGRNLDIDKAKVKQVGDFVRQLEKDGVFGTDKLSCRMPPWFKAATTPMAEATNPQSRP